MKYAILSTDATKEYYELLPLVSYSWRKIGYTPLIICVGLTEELRDMIMKHCHSFVVYATPVEGVKDSTIAQISRLFVYNKAMDEDILITGDADMVIAKDIFHCNDGFTNYGYDLTGKSELPICYNIATAKVWRELIGEFVVPVGAYSEEWNQYWSVDQQHLTHKANQYGMNRITFVDRGNQNKHGLPTGRWDRFDWAHIPDDIIDVHMKRNDWDAQIKVFQRLWPGEDYSFITKFREALDGTK